MEFPIEHDVQEVIQELDLQGLAWISVQIARTVRRGKLLHKQIHSTKRPDKVGKSESALGPFSPEEQLEIALQTVHSYFVTLDDAWAEAGSSFRETIGAEILLEGANGVAIEKPFADDYKQAKGRLRELLKPYAPGGQG